MTSTYEGTIEDRIRIRELNYSYAYLIDVGESERWASEVFTEDALFDERAFGYGLTRGRSALIAYGAKLTEVVKHVVHHMTNHVVDIESPEAASGVAFCICEVEWKDGRRERFNTIYEDRYRRVEGRWRIEERVLVKTFEPESICLSAV